MEIHMNLRTKSIIILLTLVCVSSASAEFAPVLWDTSAVAFRQGYHIEWQRAGAADEAGDICYVWSDTRTMYRDIYAQKFAPNGDMLWQAGGKPVVQAYNRQEDPDICSDGSGGFYITWVDYRADSLGDVYAQRLNSNGDVYSGWPADGIIVSAIMNTEQKSLHTIPDGAGGAMVVWHDLRSGNGDLYAHHILPNGTLDPAWGTDGNLLAGGTGNQGGAGEQSVDSDGAGGVIAAYTNFDWNIYCQRISINGTLPWGSNPIAVCTASGDQKAVKMCPDGSSGAFIVWRDFREDFNGDIYGQRINSSGAPVWTANGIAIRQEAASVKQDEPRMNYDGMNGFVLCWLDTRNSPGNDYFDVYANRLNGSGTKLWGSNDVLVCGEIYDQLEARINSDGNGGAVIVWTDERDGDNLAARNIYAQKLNASGAAQWQAGGLAVSNYKFIQDMSHIRTTSSGTSYFAWSDTRRGSPGIYNQIVNASGNFMLAEDGEEMVWGIDGDAKEQKIHKLEDNKYIMIWRDLRDYNIGGLIFQQIFDTDGNIYLPQDGIPIYNLSPGADTLLKGNYGQKDLEIISDDAGGVIVCWQDDRLIDAFGEPQIYVQRLDPQGNPMWDSTGVRVYSTWYTQENPSICSDGAGGAYAGFSGYDFAVSWYLSAVCSHIDANGIVLDSGVVVEDDFDLRVFGAVEDGEGGAIIYWRRSYETQDDDIYAARIIPPFTVAWSIPVCDAQGLQDLPTAIPYSGGGAVFAWKDERDGVADLYMQRVSNDGRKVWDTMFDRLVDYSTEYQIHRNGILIADTLVAHTVKPPSLAEDSEGNVLIVWEDQRNGPDTDIWLQKVAPNGDTLFMANGIPVAVEARDQTEPMLVMDDDNGLNVIWTDYRTIPHCDIYAVHLDNEGAPTASPWVNNGNIVCDFLNIQEDPFIVDDYNGGGIAVWSDLRSSGKIYLSNLYGQRFNDGVDRHISSGGTPIIPGEFSLNQNYPNPFNPVTAISFHLPNAGDVNLTVFNTLGQEVSVLYDGFLSAGPHKIVWDGVSNGDALSSGIYYYRLEFNGQMKVMRMIMLK